MNIDGVRVLLNSKDNSILYDVSIFINKDNNELSYVEKDLEKTFVSFDYKNNILKRDNKNMILNMKKVIFLKKV